MISELNREKAYKRFIDSGWDYFAAIAYRHYLSDGRGIIYIDFGTAEEIGSGFANCLFHFFTPQGKPEFFDEDLLQAVAEYDPEREVIFMCFLPNEQMKRFIVSGPQITPPQAFLLHSMTPTVLSTAN